MLNFSAIGQDEREKCCQIMEGTVGKSLWAADITVEEMDTFVIQIDDSSDDLIGNPSGQLTLGEVMDKLMIQINDSSDDE